MESLRNLSNQTFLQNRSLSAKLAKAADEIGLTAELLRHMPDDICNDLLLMFNHMLFSGEVPAAWRKTLFKMLPKTLKPRTTTDFRPIANIRLFYKIFAYMILGRIEDTLETSQPEEQHGFRSKRRIEEHLLTFNVILDKTLEMDQPLWIISLDLSKAFDRVNWESLWQAVGDHGVSQHLVWILQVLSRDDTGKKIYDPWKKFTILEKNLRSLEKNFSSSDPVLLWSSGPVVLWSCGPLVLWSSGPVVLWSGGPLVRWSSSPVVLWSSGPVVLWSCGPVV